MKIQKTTTVTISSDNGSAQTKKTAFNWATALRPLCIIIAKEVDSRKADAYDKEFQRILDEAVNNFYGSYGPKYYKRQGSLKFMAYSSLMNGLFGADFGVDTPGYTGSHRSGEEYIFQNSFVEGYHGGATHAGGKYWRTPYTIYSRWGSIAPKTTPPYDYIVNAWENFLNTIEPVVEEQIIDEVIADHLSEVGAICDSYLKSIS